MAKLPTPGSFTTGYDPRRGRGPKPGAPNAGRPRDEVKRQLEAILASPEVMKTLEAILKHGAQVDAKLWVKLWAVVWDRVYSRPPQEVQLDGEVQHRMMALPVEQPSIEEWHEQYGKPENARRLLPGAAPGGTGESP